MVGQEVPAQREMHGKQACAQPAVRLGQLGQRPVPGDLRPGGGLGGRALGRRWLGITGRLRPGGGRRRDGLLREVGVLPGRLAEVRPGQRQEQLAGMLSAADPLDDV